MGKNLFVYFLSVVLTSATLANANVAYNYNVIENIKGERLGHLDQKMFEAYISRGWVTIATNDKADRIRLWDIDIEPDKNSHFLTGVSSDYIYFLVLDGQAIVNGNDGAQQKIKAGEMAIWYHTGTDYKIGHFSAQDLQNSLRLNNRDDLANVLNHVVRRQKRKIFWGLLRPTYVNVAMPVIPVVEKIRRQYLVNPDLIRIKRGSTSLGEMSNHVATFFANSLNHKDIRVTEALLDPRLFFPKYIPITQAKDWPELRHKYANQIHTYASTSSELWHIKPTDETGRYELQYGDQERYHLDTSLFDYSVFVKSVIQIDHIDIDISE